MGKSTGPSYNTYSKPRPFALPTVWTKDVFMGMIFELINRETLHYSGRVIEECMYYITKEFRERGMTVPTWKIYKSSLTDYVGFTEPQTNGSHINNTPVKWFSQHIKDLQAQIDVLIADPDVPDSRAACMARTFCNGVGRAGSFTSQTKLKNEIVTPDGILNPLTRAQNGLWPFSDEYITECKTWIGISPRGVSQIALPIGDRATITTTDPNWPKSVIGKPSGTSSLIDGIDIPMDSSRRPNFADYPRRNADGKTDYDQGYGYLAHIPHVVQMVRYQPPLVETFPNNLAARHYVSRLYSNNTANLNWYLAQPVTYASKQNWGFWLIQGYAGFSNGLYLKVYDDPQTVVGEAGECPYSWLYPPASSNCSCGYATSALAVWWATEFVGFQWDEKLYAQSNRAKMKYFSRHCKLKMNINMQSAGGSNVSKQGLEIRVQTARAGYGTFNPPWVKIVDMNSTGTSRDANLTGISDMSSTYIEVDLQQRLRAVTGWYPIGGSDAIMAIWINLYATTNANWVCQAVDRPGGRVLPSDCNTRQKCTAPTLTLTVQNIRLDEVGIAGDPVSNYV